MVPMEFAVLTIATVVGTAAAFAMAWALLLGAFHLMQPATARSAQSQAASTARHSRSELVRGTRAIAQQFAAHR
jgi:hypothetical protein